MLFYSDLTVTSFSSCCHPLDLTIELFFILRHEFADSKLLCPDLATGDIWKYSIEVFRLQWVPMLQMSIQISLQVRAYHSCQAQRLQQLVPPQGWCHFLTVIALTTVVEEDVGKGTL